MYAETGEIKHKGSMNLWHIYLHLPLKKSSKCVLNISDTHGSYGKWIGVFVGAPQIAMAKLACSIVGQVAMNQTNMDVLSCKDNANIAFHGIFSMTN